MCYLYSQVSFSCEPVTKTATSRSGLAVCQLHNPKRSHPLTSWQFQQMSQNRVSGAWPCPLLACGPFACGQENVCAFSVTQSCPLWPYGLQPSRLLCPGDPPSKNTRVDCHFLLQGIFPTQGLNPHLLSLLPGEQNLLIGQTWVMCQVMRLFHPQPHKQWMEVVP